MYLNGGGAVAISTPTGRIGAGPWARHFAAAVAGDAGPSAAARGAELARVGAVRAVRVEPGAVFADVDAEDGSPCSVGVLAPLLPAGIWSAVERFARNRSALQAGVEARVQSEHLEHLLAEDWEEPLVPDAAAIARPCTCGSRGGCEHVAAVAYVFADAIDHDPSLLLRWRGVAGGVPHDEAAAVPDPWRGGRLPELEAPRPRPRPPGTLLMRLGESGIRVGEADLADVLQRAYAAFAAQQRW